MAKRKPPTDLSDETDVAHWRQRLHETSSDLESEDQFQLQQYLEELKSNPPLHLESTRLSETAEQIQFPGPQTAEAPLGQLGDYDILEELGHGTFGAVFRARDRRLQREVAIKVLHPEHAAVQSERQRFEREARAVSRLGHDHIVRIYNVCTGSDFPLPYLVMELVDGQSLADQQARRLAHDSGPFPPQQAATIVRQVALALTAAHECQLVHRDIKSSNILLESGSGRVKVTDFGLARELVSNERSTHSGRIIGTLPYMSPEQILHPDRVGEQSDLYSLGVVLYELVTGERPFRGTSPALLVQVAHDEPQSLRKLNPAIPRDLETICLKCLEKEPDRRYGSAAALAEELQRFMTGEPIQARPVALWERGGKWAKRQPTVAALLVVVLLVTSLGVSGVLWQLRRAESGRQAAKQAQGTAELARDNERALRGRLEKSDYFHRVALAHHEWLNNRQARADALLAECSEEHRGWEWRCLKRMFHPELRTLRGHTLDVRKVTFSPNGQLIASISGIWNGHDPGEVIVWDAQDSEVLHVFTARSGGFYGVAFSPDNGRLATANSKEGVAVWNLATGKKEFTATGWHCDLAFGSSGRLLAAAGGDSKVRIWNVDTGKLQYELTGHESSVFSVTFSPDGKRVASTGNQGTVRVWDARTGELTQVLEKGGNRCVAFTPDGLFLASCGYKGQDMGVVKVWEVDQWKEIVDERVTSGPVRDLCISPDGRLLALTDARHGRVRLWETTTGRERRLFPMPFSMGVAFSPNGRRLACSSSDRTVKLWDMTKDESVITRSDAAYASCLSFSPDSTHLAIAGGKNTASGRGTKTVQIWSVASTNNYMLEQVLGGHKDWITSVAYVADGRRLASADKLGAIKIWDTSSGRELLTIDGLDRVANVVFDSDGKRLASSGRCQVVRLWDPETGELIRALEGHKSSVNQVAFSPCGRLLASVSDDHTAKVWDPTTGAIRHTLSGHNEAVNCLAFSANGKLLATAGRDGLINLWEIVVRQGTAEERVAPALLRTLRGHTAAVTAVSFANGEGRLASVSQDRTVKLWDVATGQEAITLDPIGGHLPANVLFSPNGNVLAAGRRHQVTLWDASDRGQRLPSTDTRAARQRAIAWHERNASESIKIKNWFAARFHLDELIALNPTEPMYYFRRGDVYSSWTESDDDASNYREHAQADYNRSTELSGGMLFAGRSTYLTARSIPFNEYEGFTIEAWVYGGFQGTIVAQGRSGDPENSIWLSPGQGSRWLTRDTYGWESGRAGKLHNQDAIHRPLPMRWNHLALVYDGQNQRLFVNGRLLQEKEASKPGPLDMDRMLMIGGHQSRRRTLFSSGLLRSVRISKAPLYNSDFVPNEHPPRDSDTVLLYDFGSNRDWMVGATVPDLSGNGNDGTLNGTWWTD